MPVFLREEMLTLQQEKGDVFPRGYFNSKKSGGDVSFFRVNDAITQFGPDESGARPGMVLATSTSKGPKAEQHS